jgi:hypothetical protein
MRDVSTHKQKLIYKFENENITAESMESDPTQHWNRSNTSLAQADWLSDSAKQHHRRDVIQQSDNRPR